MQQLLASLVTSLSVRDAAFESGMKAASARAKQTEQDLERSTDNMGNAVERAADRINAAMVKAGETFASVSRNIAKAGAAMTIGVTAPLALAGKKAKDTASDFEAAMNGVRASMVRASPDQIKALSDAAMTMGPKFGKSASEAANAIEGLSKAGLDAAAILNGGLKSALTLSVVGQTDLGRATAISTDILSQFSRKSGDLPKITDRVVGALDATKMAANDYAQAIGQVGGIAGGLGYSFEDTNVAVAALAPSFDSGSSAGTALKAMLLQLKPTTKDAKRVFDELGAATIGQSIRFFDANRKALTFAQTAEVLRKTFGRLDEEAKREALTKAFGSDGMSAALALIEKGAAGMEEMRQSIDSVTAGEKLSVMMEGDAAASRNLANAVDALAIRIGNVLLPIFTAMKNAAASAIQWLADLPPVFHKMWVWSGVVVAAMGPLIAAIGVALPVAAAIFATRFAAIPIIITAIVNPLALLIGMIGRLAIAMGASTAIALMGARIASMATGIGLVITVVSVLVPLLFRQGQATDAARIAQDKANESLTLAASKTDQLALASGKLRDKLLEEAKAARKAAHDTMMKARASVLAAKANYIAARDEAHAPQFSTPGAAGAVTSNIMGKSQPAADAAAEWDARLRVFNTFFDEWDLWDRKIKESEKNGDPGARPDLHMDFGDPEKKKREKKGRDANRDNAQYLDEMGRLRVQALEAQAELTGGIEKRYDADMAAIEEDRAAFARNVALDEGLTDAKRKALIAANESVLYQRDMQAEQARSFAIEQRRYDLEIDRNEAMQEEVHAQIDAADSVAARRAGALRLLDLQRQNEEAVLDQIIATKKTTDIEYSNALARKDALDGIYADRRAGVERDNRGPWGDFMASLPDSAAKANEAFEAVAAGGVSSLIDGLSDAVTGARSLADVFSQMTKRIIADLVRIQIQKAIVGAFGNLIGGLGGGLSKAGGDASFGLGNSLKSFTPDLAGLSYGGGKASGGRVSPGSWYTVGENGREAFVPDSAGTIHPASALRGGRAGALSVSVDASPLLMVRVREEANTQATAVSIDSQRTQSKRARRTMGTGRR